MPTTELEVTDIPSLTELTDDLVTNALLLPCHLEALPSDQSRKVTKASLLQTIATDSLTGVAASVGDLTITGQVVFQGNATITKVCLASGSLTFGDIVAGASETQTMTVTGASVGDFLSLSFTTAVAAGLVREAWISAADTVSVRLTNVTAATIVGATYLSRASVIEGA